MTKSDQDARRSRPAASLKKLKKDSRKLGAPQHIDTIGACLPKFGFSVGIMIGTSPTPDLECAKPLDKMLVPIKASIETRKRCTSGLVTKPMKINSYGAFRCAPVSTYIGSNLTKRNCQDIGNQIAFDPEWRQAVTDNGLDPTSYKCVSPQFIEWMAGVPLGWTSPKPMPQTRQPRGRRHTCFDWFSGVGGLNQALHSAFTTVGYCERDDFCNEVLQARMNDGHLDKAPVWRDVRTIKASEIPDHDLSAMGFPCQDISIAGQHNGFEDGTRSRLFLDVMEKLAVTKPKWILIENVAAIRTSGMEHVWKTVLRKISAAGYDMKWATLKAEHAKIPMARERFFLLATRTDVVEPFPKITMADSLRRKPHMDQWLLAEPTQVDRQRLHALGNIVVPPQAQCALSIIAN